MDKSDTRLSTAKDEMVVRALILEGGMSTVTFKTDTMKL